MESLQVTTPNENNELVRYSRAGDDFHYSWAARRCLKMILPGSDIDHLVIEGVDKSEAKGAYAIDVSEYYSAGDIDVAYYQMKHSTVQLDSPFVLSDLKRTFEDFANKYRDPRLKGAHQRSKFHIITNRPFSSSLKKGVEALRNSDFTNKVFYRTICKYTGLTDAELCDFCSRLILNDGEGDFVQQRYLIEDSCKDLLVCSESAYMDTLKALVSDKALPNSGGEIYPEDVLRRFGYSSKGEFYPAPPHFPNVQHPLIRKCYSQMVEAIKVSDQPVLIHAEGGTGKTVFSSLMPMLIPPESFAIAYDCFAMGEYRRRSHTRHSYREFVMQVVNELAAKGLCEPVLPADRTRERELARVMMERLTQAVECARTVSADSELFIVVDAADNAELAADENADLCFAHELLKEEYPAHCHMILTCRPERQHLLETPSSILCLDIPQFDLEETAQHLRAHFSEATDAACNEFHGASGGNPRVQGKAIAAFPDDLHLMLNNLGPTRISVDDQIERNYQRAIDDMPLGILEQVNAIGCGLALLPPRIPIDILAKATDVDASMIKSYASDFGDSFVVTDAYIQFRDEPTEHWFRTHFGEDTTRTSAYLERLRPYANESTYVAEVIPQLLLQSGQYEALIQLALSHDAQHRKDALAERRMRIFEATYAFKAAMRKGRMCDAVRLAFICAEETAGNTRQTDLFRKNIDICSLISDNVMLENLAFAKQITGKWKGSEYAYSAAILSYDSMCANEARTHLRIAQEQLMYCITDPKKNSPKERNDTRQPNTDDFFALAIAHYNLEGMEGALNFLAAWGPQTFTFNIVRRFAKHLIDHGQYNDIDTAAERLPILLKMAVNSELANIGRFIPQEKIYEILSDALDEHTKLKTITEIPFQEASYEIAVICVAEAAIFYRLDHDLIVKFATKFLPHNAPTCFEQIGFDLSRRVFMRVAAVLEYLGITDYQKDDSWLPVAYVEKDVKSTRSEGCNESRNVLRGLLPWFRTRIAIIADKNQNLNDLLQEAYEQTNSVRHSAYRENGILLSGTAYSIINTLPFCDDSQNELPTCYFNKYLDKEFAPRLLDMIAFLYVCNRHPLLQSLSLELETRIQTSIANLKQEEDTETLADALISVAKATIPLSKPDASVYLDQAISILTRFGEELPQRWESITALAQAGAADGEGGDSLSYRFIRCAEFVGNHVYRQKYWSPRKAIRCCTELCNRQGIAAVSRWRDKDIGDFSDSFATALTACAKSGFASPALLWCFAPFLRVGEILDFGSTCFFASEQVQQQKNIVSEMLHYSEMLEARIEDWDEIRLRLLDMDGCTDIISAGDVLAEQLDAYKRLRTARLMADDKCATTQTEKISELIFMDMDYSAHGTFEQVLSEFKSNSELGVIGSEFWNQLIRHTPIGNITTLMSDIANSQRIGFYDFRDFVDRIPSTWKSRLSFQKAWNGFLTDYARRHAVEIIGWIPARNQWSKSPFDDEGIACLVDGAIQGVQSQSLQSSDEYLSFAQVASMRLLPDEARTALDFALQRLETTFPQEYDVGDGAWSEKLLPPQTADATLGGFLWSALGSPSVETRWDAVHALHNAALTGNVSLLSEVVALGNSIDDGCFGHVKYPFYKYDAQQFLLFALRRISIDAPQVVWIYFDFVCSMIENTDTHALLQRTAIQILGKLKKALPECISDAAYNALVDLAISPYEPLYRSNASLPPSTTGELDDADEHSFWIDYDFNKYWVKGVATLFNLSDAEAKRKLCAIIRRIDPNYKGGYKEEPRSELFTSAARQMLSQTGTEYPKLVTYQFYLCYHALFILANELKSASPCFFRYDDECDDPWETWIEEYDASCMGGYLLSDFRAPRPTDILMWDPICSDSKAWENAIKQPDHDAVVKPDVSQICISGSWAKTIDHYREDVIVSSALVTPSTAPALATALMGYADAANYKLPDYLETEYEYMEAPFQLKGWIKQEDSDLGIYKFDYWAGGITYPIEDIGDEYSQMLPLIQDEEKLTYTLGSKGNLAIERSAWGEASSDQDDYRNHGSRITASIDFLKTLCRKTGMTLIIETQITRRMVYPPYYRNSGEHYTYRAPSHMIYLFNEKGELFNGE